MNKNKLILTTILASAFLIRPQVSYASQEVGKAKDEGWDVPNVALGNGLSASERLETLNILEVDKNNPYNEFIVDGDDLVKYVTDVPEFTSQSKAYSSAYIVRTTNASGVNVEIKTPQNITARTEANYRNAAITSGIYDADIHIGSVRVMDGSGALAGIYKIYDEVEPAQTQAEQQERDQSREVAQKESAVTAEISSENASNDAFSDENLAVAMADIKLELQKINDKLDKMSADKAREQVQTIVADELTNQGLSEIVTPKQQEQIVDTMLAFQESPSINNDKLKEQLDSLKNDIMDNGKEFIANAKEKLTSEETKSFLANLFDKISNFFSNLFN